MAEHLSDAHKHEIARFIAHFRSTRERHVREMVDLITEVQEDRVTEEILQRGDVYEIFNDAKEQVAMRQRDQFEAETLRSAAHLATILGFAQAAGVELEADVNTVEDSSRCQAVANVSAMIGAPRPAPAASRLQPMEAVVGGGASAQEIRDLKLENRQMLDRYQQMQKQVSDLLKERSMLTDELEGVKATFLGLKEQMLMGGAQGAAASDSMEMELMNARAQLDNKTAELEGMSNELNKRVGDSSQFKEMRSIISKKNQQIKEMRARLAMYEPMDDVVADED
jgi:leucine zipper transcription factor-like protein 1